MAAKAGAPALHVMTIRDATETDCTMIANVQLEASRIAYANIFPPFEDIEAKKRDRALKWKAFVNDSETELVVRDDRGSIDGYVHFGKCRDEDRRSDNDAEIWSIHVHPSAWRKGIGTALVCEVIDRLSKRGGRSLSLWVLEKNNLGISFYQNQGFLADGRIKKHPSGVTEIRMIRRIDKS